jgi:hypothetical protein
MWNLDMIIVLVMYLCIYVYIYINRYKSLFTHIYIHMIGSTVAVYNGKVFNLVDVKAEMVGYYLGEFSITYRFVIIFYLYMNMYICIYIIVGYYLSEVACVCIHSNIYLRISVVYKHTYTIYTYMNITKFWFQFGEF